MVISITPGKSDGLGLAELLAANIAAMEDLLTPLGLVSHLCSDVERFWFRVAALLLILRCMFFMP